MLDHIKTIGLKPMVFMWFRCGRRRACVCRVADEERRCKPSLFGLYRAPQEGVSGGAGRDSPVTPTMAHLSGELIVC